MASIPAAGTNTLYFSPQQCNTLHEGTNALQCLTAYYTFTRIVCYTPAG